MTRLRWVGWPPLVSVSYNENDALRAYSTVASRRSERAQAARDKEKEERKEGAVRGNDAEDAVEDSDGPGSDPGRAQRE